MWVMLVVLLAVVAGAFVLTNTAPWSDRIDRFADESPRGAARSRRRATGEHGSVASVDGGGLDFAAHHHSDGHAHGHAQSGSHGHGHDVGPADCGPSGDSGWGGDAGGGGGDCGGDGGGGGGGGGD